MATDERLLAVSSPSAGGDGDGDGDGDRVGDGDGDRVGDGDVMLREVDGKGAPPANEGGDVEERLTLGSLSCTRLQFWTTVVVLSLVVVFIIVAAVGTENDDERHLPGFLHITDLHVNPLYDARCPGNDDAENCSGCGTAGAAKHTAPNGRYGCDPPAAFVDGLLTRVAQNHAEGARFVLVSGDLAAHDLGSAQGTLDAIKMATDLLKKAFGGLAVYPTVGNNDHQGVEDYCVTPGPNVFLDTLWGYFSAWLPSSQETNFKTGGYYVVEDVVPDLTLLVFNSVYYSVSFNFTSCGGNTIDQNDPAGQFAWMEATLAKAAAARNRVVMLSHIPPAGDEYADKVTWRSAYVTRFLGIVETYKDTVHVQLYGHFHRDEMRVQRNAAGDVIGAALCAPSVSPVFRGNPGYRWFNYTARVAFGGEFTLLDYVQHYVPLRVAALPIKTAYAWSDYLGANQPITPSTVAAVVARIQTDESAMAAYDSRRFLFHGPSADALLCALDIDASVVPFGTCLDDIDRYDR